MKNGGKTAKAAKNDEKQQKTLEKRRNGKKLWKTTKIILGAASKFFLALAKRPQFFGVSPNFQGLVLCYTLKTVFTPIFTQ